MYPPPRSDSAAVTAVPPNNVALLSNSPGLHATNFGLPPPGMVPSAEFSAFAAARQAQMEAARLAYGGAVPMDPSVAFAAGASDAELMGLERSLAAQAAHRQAMFFDMQARSAAGAGFPPGPGGIVGPPLLQQPPGGAERDVAIAHFAAAARAAEAAAAAAQRDFAVASRQLHDLEAQNAMEQRMHFVAGTAQHVQAMMAAKQMQNVGVKPVETKAGGKNGKRPGSSDLEAAQACINLSKTNTPPMSPTLPSGMPCMPLLPPPPMGPPPIGIGAPSTINMAKRKLPGTGELADLEAASGGKKKRTKPIYPEDMPRRPLSAYNFFFSEERENILEGIEGDGDGESKKSESAAAAADVTPPEKKEGDSTDDTPTLSSAAYRMLMRQRTTEKKKRRPHRKTHGKIGFKDLAKTIGQRWRALPTERVNHYRKLAEMDLQRYRTAMFEYNDKRAQQGLPPISTK